MLGETNASTSAGGSSVYYGTCSTPASTVAKAVTVGEKFKLVQGAMIVVTFTNANSASTPTLNVTPSGGSATGAKSIRIKASSALNSASTPETDYYTVRGTCEFIYDGTYWILVTGRKASHSLRLDDSSGTSLGVYYPTGQHNTQVITLPMGSRELTDVQAVFTLQATPDFAEFPYCAEITDSGVTPNTYVSVTYSNEQSQSLMYSPTAVSDIGKIKLYARQAVGTQTIPTIGIGLDYVDLDSSQPISSPIETRTLTLVSSSDTEYSGFPYKYSFPCVGATATRTADVTFDVSDAQSGNFAPVCETGAGVIYIWARASQSTARIGYMLYYTENATVVSGTVGDDTHPVKIVNGQAVAVTNALAKDFSPNTYSAFRTDWKANTNIVVGFIQYQRIAPKKGVLSGTLYIQDNSLSSDFVFLTLSRVGSILGVSFNTSVPTRVTGWWVGYDVSNNSVWIDGMQLAPTVQVYNSSGNIQFGRYYGSVESPSGFPGDWPLHTLRNTKVMFGDVIVEEN